MRLWHYSLISVLPKKQLISQWRECIAIKRQWEKGTLKHSLVSYVMKYNKEVFFNYVYNVIEELEKRNINYNNKYLEEIRCFCKEDFEYNDFVIYPEHNNRYLKQCFYNLQEKYDRGIITNEEYSLIHDKILIELGGIV